MQNIVTSGRGLQKTFKLEGGGITVYVTQINFEKEGAHICIIYGKLLGQVLKNRVS